LSWIKAGLTSGNSALISLHLLEKLYDSKSETFKQKATQSVAAGFERQYGVDLVFGKAMAWKVKRTLIDRYLIQSDRRVCA
jgi:hypothetical protein